MEKLDVKYFKFLLVVAIVSCLLSMKFGYQFGGEDALRDHYHLYSNEYGRDIYVSEDTSSHLIWTGDTLTFQPK